MKQYVIYGASDDLIEVKGAEREEYTVPPIGDRWSFTLAMPDGAGVRIHVAHEQSGCWSAGVSPLDEDQAVPGSWRLHLVPGGEGVKAPGYSTALVAEVDDDAVLTFDQAEEV